MQSQADNGVTLKAISSAGYFYHQNDISLPVFIIFRHQLPVYIVTFGRFEMLVTSQYSNLLCSVIDRPTVFYQSLLEHRGFMVNALGVKTV